MGVDRNDIAGVVLTSRAVLLQEPDGTIKRDEAAETFAQVDALRMATPDIVVTVRLDITFAFNRKAVLEYANANPDVKIALFMSAESSFIADSLGRKTAEAEQDNTNGKIAKMQEISADRLVTAQRSRKAAHTRLDAAKVNLESYQRGQLGRDELPPNLELVVAVKNYESR